MRILLTGKTGQVGRDLLSLLRELGELRATDRQELDLADPEAIRRILRSYRPELIVNAAAYTAVDQAEHDQAAAHAINAVAPGVLAEGAKELGAVLVHYSTDYVFDGTKRSPYLEDDATNPLNVYGSTKLAGERAIQGSGALHLIFRTAWVYSKRGKNFLLAILRLASQREELRIVNDQIGAPTWSREIAAATHAVLLRIFARQGNGLSVRNLSGIYHMTAGGSTTWYEFANTILASASAQSGADWFRNATNGSPLRAQQIIPINTSEFPTPARRPSYSVLSNRRLNEVFDVKLPDWQRQLATFFSAPS